MKVKICLNKQTLTLINFTSLTVTIHRYEIHKILKGSG